MSRGAWIAGAVVVILLAGCGAAPPAPEDQFYRLLAPEVVDAEVRRTLDATVVVKRFSADGVLDQRAIAFADATTPEALKHYNYHFWSDPPTHLLQDYTVKYLRAAGVARRVVPMEVGVDGGFEVLGRVRRFEHLRKAQESVAVTLELGLLRTEDRALLLLEDYSATQPTAGAAPVYAVRALNEALNELLARFAADIDSLD